VLSNGGGGIRYKGKTSEQRPVSGGAALSVDYILTVSVASLLAFQLIASRLPRLRALPSAVHLNGDTDRIRQFAGPS
jgi:hypothetical protein